MAITDAAMLSNLEVVIMEDDANARKFLHGALKNLGVGRVYVAENAEKAMYYAEKRKQRNYIVDIHLGDDRYEEGLDVLEKLKELDKDIFVAILSGFPDTYRRKAQRLGADIFQAKSPKRGLDVLSIVDKLVLRRGAKIGILTGESEVSRGSIKHQESIQVVPSEVSQVKYSSEVDIDDIQDTDKVFLSKSELADLFAKLEEIKKSKPGDYWWLDHVCSNSIIIAKEFKGASTLEEFYNENFVDSSPIAIELERQIDSISEDDASKIAILGIYPSKAIRSIPADVSMEGRRIHVVIENPLVFLDPNQNQANTEISSFTAKVTLFAIDCM